MHFKLWLELNFRLEYIYFRLEYIYFRLEYIYLRLEYIYFRLEYIYLRLEYIYFRLEYIYFSLEYIYFRLEYIYFRLEYIYFRLEYIYIRLDYIYFRLEYIYFRLEYIYLGYILCAGIPILGLGLGLELWCLTPLSTIFQLYHEVQFLSVEETGASRENHRSPASNWQNLSHNVVSSTHHLIAIRTHNFSGDRYRLHM